MLQVENYRIRVNHVSKPLKVFIPKMFIVLPAAGQKYIQHLFFYS